VSRFAPPPLRWSLQPAPDAVTVELLAQELELPRALAGLLVQRGHGAPGDARTFLRPGLDGLADPASLRDLPLAADSVAHAVRAGRRILVHGDYDVDGQCASALLVRALRYAGADVVPFLPHRLRDGYDFGPAGVAAAREAGASLVVTVDCGIRAVESVAAARAAGVDVVVTDHHLPGPELPVALAVVDPNHPDDRSGLGHLCGAGVAFKLVQALVPRLGLPPGLPLHLLDYVALATVADLVPLVGENRVLVRHGLKVLAGTRWPGLRALLEAGGLAGQAVRAGHAAFLLGPRLNAAGRLGDAALGLRLLLTDDPSEAAVVAAELERLNGERQEVDRRILEEVLDRIEREGDPERDAGLVLGSETWHPGVVGIVASRVVERYGRPTFLVAFDGDLGKGSGRSVSRVDLHAALAECGHLLERYGGHRMAAGLTIHRRHFDEFRERFAAAVRARVAPMELAPEQRVDLVIGLGDATDDLERLCRHLEPCGMGNPGPVFGVRGAQFGERRRVGSNHLRGVLAEGGRRLETIGFQWADRVPWLGDAPVDAAFKLERNEWNGRSTLQARLVALTPAAG
jgi:single-stranded-DNA-specific exonuclease